MSVTKPIRKFCSVDGCAESADAPAGELPAGWVMVPGGFWACPKHTNSQIDGVAADRCGLCGARDAGAEPPRSACLVVQRGGSTCPGTFGPGNPGGPVEERAAAMLGVGELPDVEGFRAAAFMERARRDEKVRARDLRLEDELGGRVRVHCAEAGCSVEVLLDASYPTREVRCSAHGNGSVREAEHRKGVHDERGELVMHGLQSDGTIPVGHVAGRKDDQGKPRYSLLPLDAVAAVVRVLEWGARKYGEDNWRKVDGAVGRYWDAALRHLVAWRGGELLDPDTGESHLAHAACSILFALDLTLEDET